MVIYKIHPSLSLEKKIQKRNLIIIASIVAVAIIGVISIGSSYAARSDSEFTAKITPEEAATIAINHLGAQPSNLVTVDKDKQNDSFIYSVELIIGDKAISVEIDPQTGQILAVEQEPVGISDQEGTSDDSEQEDGDD